MFKGNLGHLQGSVEGLKEIDRQTAINDEFAQLLSKFTSIMSLARDVKKNVDDRLTKVKSKIKARSKISKDEALKVEQAKQLKYFYNDNKDALDERQEQHLEKARDFAENTAATYAIKKGADAALGDFSLGVTPTEGMSILATSAAMTETSDSIQDTWAQTKDHIRHPSSLTSRMINTVTSPFTSTYNYLTGTESSDSDSEDRPKLALEDKRFDPKNGEVGATSRLNIPQQALDESTTSTVSTLRQAGETVEDTLIRIRQTKEYLSKFVTHNQTIILSYALMSIITLVYAKYRGHKIKAVFKEIQALQEDESIEFADLLDVCIDEPLSPTEQAYNIGTSRRRDETDLQKNIKPAKKSKPRQKADRTKKTKKKKKMTQKRSTRRSTRRSTKRSTNKSTKRSTNRRSKPAASPSQVYSYGIISQ
jgi:hypothetical protein